VLISGSFPAQNVLAPQVSRSSARDLPRGILGIQKKKKKKEIENAMKIIE